MIGFKKKLLMKKILLLLLVGLTLGFKPMQDSAFDVGEKFVFKISYGFLNAGFATLEVKDATIKNKSVFHVIGKGYTTGMSKLFFKVDDNYESYIDKETRNPYQYIRKIDEGGYTKNEHGYFNQSDNKILVKDFKHSSEKTFSVSNDAQDLLSSFYYLRNYPNIEKMNVGESVSIDMFFDEKTNKFKLKFLGRETIRTKFGFVSAMIFRPLVQSGRIFKEEESVTVWISDDENKLPIRIKASLLVGSLKAELDSYSGLKHPFVVRKKK